MDVNNTNPSTEPAPAQNSTSNNQAPNTTTAKHSENIAIFAYLGPLVIIPYLTSKDNSFVKFHIKQGLVLISIEIICWLLMSMFFWTMWPLISLVKLLTFILAILGIVNVVQKKEKELPLVGSFAHYFNNI
ncbi:MAG: hypothetical protein K2P31_00890 [Rickettsiaceae bacterium]|nr:hypothetical protein [Rickettsiaceae bacterium]